MTCAPEVIQLRGRAVSRRLHRPVESVAARLPKTIGFRRHLTPLPLAPPDGGSYGCSRRSSCTLCDRSIVKVLQKSTPTPTHAFGIRTRRFAPAWGCS